MKAIMEVSVRMFVTSEESDMVPRLTARVPIGGEIPSLADMVNSLESEAERSVAATGYTNARPMTDEEIDEFRMREECGCLPDAIVRHREEVN